MRRELERGLVAAMTDLVLQRTGSSTQYEVIAEDEIVGRNLAGWRSAKQAVDVVDRFYL